MKFLISVHRSNVLFCEQDKFWQLKRKVGARTKLCSVRNWVVFLNFELWVSMKLCVLLRWVYDVRCFDLTKMLLLLPLRIQATTKQNKLLNSVALGPRWFWRRFRRFLLRFVFLFCPIMWSDGEHHTSCEKTWQINLYWNSWWIQILLNFLVAWSGCHKRFSLKSPHIVDETKCGHPTLHLWGWELHLPVRLEWELWCPIFCASYERLGGSPFTNLQGQSHKTKVIKSRKLVHCSSPGTTSQWETTVLPQKACTDRGNFGLKASGFMRHFLLDHFRQLWKHSKTYFVNRICRFHKRCEIGLAEQQFICVG